MLKIQIMNMTMIHMITRTLKKESYYMKGFMPILLLVLFFVNEVQSQNNFGTSNGIIVFTAMIDNQPVKYVSNELDNDYPGNLKNEPHIAPFLGTNFNFWENGSGFLNNIQFNLKVGWSLTGKFFGLFSTIGITFRVR